MSQLADLVVAGKGSVTCSYTEVAIYPDGTTKILTHKSWTKDPTKSVAKKKVKKESFDVTVDGEIEL